MSLLCTQLCCPGQETSLVKPIRDGENFIRALCLGTTQDFFYWIQ